MSDTTQSNFTPATTYQPSSNTVIIATTQSPAVGAEPTRLTCPSCHAEVVTQIDYKANSRTHVWALVLCLFCCWPCVFVPYCTNSCRSANHHCPNCNAYIGTYVN